MGLFSSNKVAELFAFNLLPPKSRAEIDEEARRKKALLNTMIAPGVCLIVAALFFLVNLLMIEPTRNNWQRAVNTIKSQLSDTASAIGQLKVTNGELKIKTDFIAEPVQKNVDFENIFQVAQQAFASNSSRSSATSYGREDTGRFVVNGVSRAANGPAEILQKFRLIKNVKDPELKTVNLPTANGEYRFSITFDITSVNLASSAS